MPSPTSFGQRPLTTPPDYIDRATWTDITALPRQVGRWIADVDQGGGDVARRAEVQAIHDFLVRAQHKFQSIPLMGHICRAALDVPVTNPLREVALFIKIDQGISRMRHQCTPLEVNAYKLLLIEMAEAVARAAADGPEQAYNLMNGPTSGWHGLYPMLMNHLMRFGRGPRVSLKEKQAINRLIDQLDAGHMVEKWQIGDTTRPSVRVFDHAAGQKS